MGFSIIYVTAKTKNEAKKIANTLVKEKLVACANIIPKIESTYWWKNRIERHGEAAIILKTKKNLVDSVTKRIKEIHSYTVPCVISLSIEKGNKDYLEWVDKEVK